MSAIVRRPVCHVVIDGQEVTNRFSARWSLDYAQRMGDATILVPFTPSWVGFGSYVVIRAGASEATAVVRWAGFVVKFSSAQWPGRVQISCKGPLFYANQDMNAAINGIDLSAAGAGQTDQAIVAFLLHEAGLDAYITSIGGTGLTLGTVATDQYLWRQGQTALDAIDMFDQICLGWRTFETLGGRIVRQQITAGPAATAALSFASGVDILGSSTCDTSIENIVNLVFATGYSPAGATDPFNYWVQQANPYVINGSPSQTISSPLIEKSATADAGNGLACQQVAEWQLAELNRGLVVGRLDTPRDDVIGPGMTAFIDDLAYLGIKQNVWVQGIAGEYTERGAFRQSLSFVGNALGTGGVGNTTGGTSGGDGGGLSGGGPGGGGGSGGSGGGGGNPPGTTPPTVDFTITVERETVIVSGSAVTLYVVSCSSAASPGSAAIAAYAWTTSGGSPTVASGSDPDFTTAYAAISTQTITLTVTDSDGASAAVTHPLPAAGGAGYLVRRLFLAGTSDIEDFDGSAWRTHGDASTLVANGPIWAVGANVLTSADDLQTAPVSSTPFGSGTVTALWFEGDFNDAWITAGSSNGAVAYSTDSGVSWTIMNAAPSAGNAVIRVVKSRAVSGQYFALTAGGLFRTDNNGSGWATVVSAAGGETFRDLSVSFARIMIAMSGGRLVCDQAGVAQTLPTNSGDITAITADIRRDRFYAYDSAGHTFAHTADGGTAMGAKTALPVTAAVRGLWRDSHIPKLLYVAAGNAYKSVDGFGSSGGYFQLRVPGTAGAPGGASYAQIGVDGTLARQPLAPYSLASDVVGSSTSTAPVALTLWNGSSFDAPPAGWQDVGFNDSGWGVVVNSQGAYNPVIPGATIISDVNPGTHTGWEMLTRHSFTLDVGVVGFATLRFRPAVQLIGLWLNGTFIASEPEVDWPGTPNPPAPYSVPIPPSFLRTNALNVIACWAKARVSPPDLTSGMVYRLDINR